MFLAETILDGLPLAFTFQLILSLNILKICALLFTSDSWDMTQLYCQDFEIEPRIHSEFVVSILGLQLSVFLMPVQGARWAQEVIGGLGSPTD